jgi:uncharacterized protein (DUF433 family)
VDVLQLLSAGASFEEVLADYPFLKRENFLAATEYAALTDRPRRTAIRALVG